MSHAIHFLERLERIEPAEVELAMALYQDTPLVHALISRAKVPQGATRVALSLGDPQEGPFVVLERSGAFVTCLARGMRPGDLPIITRAKFESVAGQLTELRQRIALAREVTGKDEKGAMYELHRRLVNEAYSLTREELRAALAFLPVLAPALVSAIVNAHPVWRRLRAALASRAHMRRTDDARFEELETFGQLGFSLATEIQLVLTASVDHPEAIRPGVVTSAMLAAVATLGLHLGHGGMRARVFNGIGRAGHLLVSSLKRDYAAQGEYGPAKYRLGLALIACGAAHPKLKAELQKFFLRGGEPETGFSGLLDNEPEELLDTGRDKSWQFDCALAEQNGTPRQFATAEDVPADLVPAVLASLTREEGDDEGDPKERLIADVLSVPLFARARADELYLPRGVFEAVRQWPASFRAEQLVENEQTRAAHRPHAVAPTAGRNDPCPCASGKKFKKCCGG